MVCSSSEEQNLPTITTVIGYTAELLYVLCSVARPLVADELNVFSETVTFGLFLVDR